MIWNKEQIIEFVNNWKEEQIYICEKKENSLEEH